MAFQWSRSVSSSLILCSNSSTFSIFFCLDLRAARVLRARFMAVVSLGSSTTIGGRGLSRLRDLPTPETEECLFGGEDFDCDRPLRSCSCTSSSSEGSSGESADGESSSLSTALLVSKPLASGKSENHESSPPRPPSSRLVSRAVAKSGDVS